MSRASSVDVIARHGAPGVDRSPTRETYSRNAKRVGTLSETSASPRAIKRC
jgi:hypothetical protein